MAEVRQESIRAEYLKPGVHVTKDRVPEILKLINDLTKKTVVVGIPAENAERDDGGEFNNAAIGYINEFGNRTIPARPHLIPGVRAIQDKIIGRLKAASILAMDGKKEAVDAQLDSVGLEAVSSVRQMITNTLSPPLSPKTIYNRQHRNDKPKRMGTQPLLDFGDYLRHITYAIRKT